MRRQLILGAAAVTATVVIAFVVPLGLAVRALAANRPLNDAEQMAQSVATVFALTDDTQVTRDAVVAAQARTDSSLTVYLRGDETLGVPLPRSPHVDRAFAGASFAADVGDARHVLVPATRAEGTVAVVVAAVPQDVLTRGVARSWLLLLALGVGLLALAAVIADRLGRTVVGPARDLATTARRIAGGDVTARVVPSGPPEVAEVGGALNGLAARITDLLAAEREMVADLSHRLRTPLTALRLDAEAVADSADRHRLRADVDAVEATVTELIREAREPDTSPPDTAIDLAPIVRERARYWGALADEQGREWSLEVAEDTIPVRIRPPDAEALLDVLLDNVFSHTPDGTRYWVRLEADRLIVEDAGPDLDALPQPGERGRSDTGSTGLGLDIARQTAQRSGAHLQLSRRQPSGLRVAVVWPAAAD